MATKEQIKANRQNAQKSTGPKSDEGKAAVSQNAVKHGIFAQSVIYGENEADYEAFHDNFLAELAPVGAVELMLAERAINLSWRLRRAERMQNEVIEDMIGRKVTCNPARRARESYYANQGIYRGDPRRDLDDLPLGRIATNDFAYCRVLDRMLMYERRIENSLHKTLRELERRQLIRLFQQQEAERDKPSPSLRDEAATRSSPAAKQGDLKKQSQYMLGQNSASSCAKGCYDNLSAGRIEENKAKETQISTLSSLEGIGKKKESLTEVALLTV